MVHARLQAASNGIIGRRDVQTTTIGIGLGYADMRTVELMKPVTNVVRKNRCPIP